jgi:hypothetical protein
MLSSSNNSAPCTSWLGRLRVAAIFVVALAVGTVASAQPAQPGSGTTPAADPPARVGRISALSGPVTLTDYRANEESDAVVNWPITSQQRLSTGEIGRAEVRIGSTAVWLDTDSVVDFNRIDDDVIQIAVQRGSVAMQVRNREQLHDIDFFTPRERVVFEDVGTYRIDVDRTPGVSAVTAQAGSARVLNGRLDFMVQTGQRGESTAEPMAFQVVAPASDAFDQWVMVREQTDSQQATRYVSPETTGVDSLDAYGQWRPVEDYGNVWFPTTVVAGWAPYRYGRWAYIPPWGWTWIDNAAWGFTPFHYGRWIYVHNTWGWVPGAYVGRPCYAPALVAWYGTPGVGVGFGASVGWFPLAPGEVFIPSFNYTRRYLTQVNSGYATNINVTVINSTATYRYKQPNFSTWAPSDALVRRTPINRVAQPAPSEWAKLPAMRQPPVKVTDDARRIKPELVKAAPPQDPLKVLPPRQVERRPDEASRLDAPARIPAPKDRGARSDALIHPPPSRAVPSEDRVAPPVQRAPRSQAPRQSTPDSDFVAQPRAPKTQQIERPVAPSGQVAAPAPQIAPRRALRQDLAPHPAAVPFAGPTTPTQPAVPRVAPSAPVAPAVPGVAPTAPVPSHPAVPRAAPNARQEVPAHRFVTAPRVQTAEIGPRAKAQ